jgi:basic membrane protein A
MRGSRFRIACLGAGLVAVAALTAGAATANETAATPQVVLVLERGGGCPARGTLELCEGIREAMRRTGVTGKIVAPTFRESVADVLGLLARQRYELVITFGQYFEPRFGPVVAHHPAVPFALMDASRTVVKRPPRNLQGVVFRTSEAAYLAGWLAGKLERRRPGRDVVGIVGGMKVPSVRDFVVGFAAGARRAAPGIEVLVDYSDDWIDQSKCAALARHQIARGAGTVFNVAGECGLGTLAAAASSGVWGVGVDSDQSFLGPHVLTSVLKRFDAGFLALLRQVKAGRVVTGRDTVLGMRDGAVGLGTISSKVPPPLVEQVDELRRKIIRGTIVVPSFPARRPG